MIDLLKRLTSKKILNIIRPVYHLAMSITGCLIYRFPSRKIKIVAVTGTKGKSTVVEMINSIFETAGLKTALAGTIRFKIGSIEKRNLFKMTMPGRFFLQKLLRQAVDEKCDWAVIEMTSEGVKQFRHKFIDLDALVFLNLSPEHIESHGSYEKYRAAKLKLAESLSRSSKKDKILVVNGDDKESNDFLKYDVPEKIKFNLKDAAPYRLKDGGFEMIWRKQSISSPLRGLFNISNMLAAATFAESVGIGTELIKNGLEKIKTIRGRVEEVDCGKKIDFKVFVDYAHTPDSLTAFYETFRPSKKTTDQFQSSSGKKLICVLGNTGGGRDKWKRPEMARIAEKYCDTIILTNEDPYDEEPRAIINDMAAGMKNKKLKIIIDRREAIREALTRAKENDVVLITGKGTDPYIMGKNGQKTPWDDVLVAQQELLKLN